MQRPSSPRAGAPAHASSLAALAVAVAAGAAVLAGCGYTEQEWRAQVDKYERTRAKLVAAEGAAEHARKELERTRAETGRLARDLEAAGVDPAELRTAAEAIAQRSALDTKQRALVARVRTIREAVARAEPSAGMTVGTRRQRIAIVVPGDALFDPGKPPAITKAGRALLAKIADALRDEPAMLGRAVQVACHAEAPAKKGAKADAWQTSFAQAHLVLRFFQEGEGGKLPVSGWSAAGYADTDPVAPGDTPEARAKNRRCEILASLRDDETLP